MPGVVGERLFAVSDKNKDGYLNFLEFTSSILTINSNDINIIMRLVFDIYDFDSDDFINVEDIKTILLHTFNAGKYLNDHHKEIAAHDSSKRYTDDAVV